MAEKEYIWYVFGNDILIVRPVKVSLWRRVLTRILLGSRFALEQEEIPSHPGTPGRTPFQASVACDKITGGVGE